MRVDSGKEPEILGNQRRQLSTGKAFKVLARPENDGQTPAADLLDF
jgi:hypothetical protein